ncbi:MAG: hypothetical protein ABR549_19030 [Mycobacteriales bacterium]
MTDTNVSSTGTMTASGSGAPAPMPAGLNPATSVPRHRVRRLSTETKSSWKTTELMAYVGAVIAIAIASQTIGKDTGAAGGDYFRADKAFLYITMLTIGYLLSRGLAKSGSRDYYDDDVS